MHSWTSCIFSMPTNDIERADGICSLTSAWMNFQDYFYIHESF